MSRTSDIIRGRINRRHKRRLMLAVALTLLLVGALALTGGVGSAASAVSDGSSAVKRIVAGTSETSATGSTGAAPKTQLIANAGVSSATAQYSNKVVICHHPRADPSSWVTITVSQNAVKAHLKHGDTLGPCAAVKKTKLAVSITPSTATLQSGIPITATIVTKNIGNATAWTVITCVTLPPGVTIAKASGGYAAKGRYCWRAKTIGAGTRSPAAKGAKVAAGRVIYTIKVRGDARLSTRVRLVASAQASNAPRVGDTSRILVIGSSTTATGGYTG